METGLKEMVKKLIRLGEHYKGIERERFFREVKNMLRGCAWFTCQLSDQEHVICVREGCKAPEGYTLYDDWGCNCPYSYSLDHHSGWRCYSTSFA